MNIKIAFENSWYANLGWDSWFADFKEDIKDQKIRQMMKNCKQIGFITPLLNRSLRTDRGQQRAIAKMMKRSK
jgi:hypothetical protein